LSFWALTAIAIPIYTAYVVRAKRAEARATLMQAAQFMERNYSQAGCYNHTNQADCTAGAGILTALPPTLTVVPVGGAPNYAVALTPALLVSQGYTLTATPCGAGGCTGGSAFTDAACGVLALDNTGTRSAAAAVGAAAVSQCWER
jgi:type IV pilus assembly protein PilE